MTRNIKEIKVDYEQALFELTKKKNKCRLQREHLLSDFVENFDLDNLHDVEKYDKALRILRISEKILEVRIKQLQLIKERNEHK